MDLKIRKYNPVLDYENLVKLVQSEGEEWEEYLNPTYVKALDNSLTYVALKDDELCGYSRSISDSGLFVWVIDLLVHKNHRGHSIGKKLMECIITDFPNTEVYVMSDVDAYYVKLGYKKEGSIFRVSQADDKT